MFRFAATSVLFVGISRLLRGERWLEALESRRWHDLPSLEALAGFCLQRMTVFQRSGAPGDIRSPADDRK